MKQFKIFGITMMLVLGMGFVSCSDDDEEIVEEKVDTGIPDDSLASPNPDIDESTTSIPNIQYSVESINNIPVVRIDLTGVQNQETLEWMKLYGTGSVQQNIWVEVDEKPKGITVYNNSDNEENKAIKADLVFLVDNSGSMSEEANTIARDIISWSEKLATSGLDIRFGCVGYDGEITGAINITTVDVLSNYLNRYSGTSRTTGFDGDDANSLASASSSYLCSTSQRECGAAALRFADEQFTFRSGANRIYVNFTDEPNQPNYIERFSVENFKDQQNWNTVQGTVHTVYSDTYTSFTERTLYNEYPWKLSEYTGGTIIYTSSSFSGVSLESLPVTGAMENSYILKFGNIDGLLDGETHNVKITIQSLDKKVKAEREFNVVFGSK